MYLKKRFILYFLVLSFVMVNMTVKSQNTFPTSGSVGIGTTIPNSLVQAVNGVSDFRFSTGASALTPTISVLNTNTTGKAAALLAGTNGSAFTFDKSGYFMIQGALKSSFTSNNLGADNYYVRVNGDGKFGVGTNYIPTQLFDVNSKFVVDGTSGNIGIGTTLPSQKLEVTGTVLSNSDIWKPYGFYTSKHANFFRQNAYYDGTWKSYLGGGEYSKASVCVASTPDNCAFGVMVDNSIATANEPISFTNLFTVKTSGNVLVPGKVLIGSVDENLIGQYQLSVNGTAIFTKILVKSYGSSWADYVFEPTYQLRSLQSLEEYVNKYKHLPDLPSAADVAKDGNDIAATQLALLKKVEELTLYVIKQDKKIIFLENEIRNIKISK